MITKNTNRMTDGATVNVLDFGAGGDAILFKKSGVIKHTFSMA